MNETPDSTAENQAASAHDPAESPLDPTEQPAGPEQATRTERPNDQPQSPGGRARTRRLLLRVGIVLAAVVLVLVAVDYASSSPQLCNACHEMSPRHARWAESAHAEVVCVSCHQPPTAWYQLPQRLVARGRLLARDTWWHVADRSDDTTTPDNPEASGVSSENCLECHDPNRKATSGFRILIDHAEHAERNGSCLSCHRNTGHPEEQRGRALSLMDQCYECHGTAEYPEASADCNVCHPKDYELLPASHKESKWERGDHGKIAQSDREQCGMCHEQAFCTDCHGLAMPHPASWAKNHAPKAQQDRVVCGRCHLEKPDLCSMCHHKGWEPKKGPWITQHPLMVREKGAAFCMECHGATHCTSCHAGRLGVSAASEPL